LIRLAFFIKTVGLRVGRAVRGSETGGFNFSSMAVEHIAALNPAFQGAQLILCAL